MLNLCVHDEDQASFVLNDQYYAEEGCLSESDCLSDSVKPVPDVALQIISRPHFRMYRQSF
jgi:hypothetical protein